MKSRAELEMKKKMDIFHEKENENNLVKYLSDILCTCYLWSGLPESGNELDTSAVLCKSYASNARWLGYHGNYNPKKQFLLILDPAYC